VGPRSSCRSTRLVGGEIHVEVAPHDVAHLGLVERRAVELVSEGKVCALVGDGPHLLVYLAVARKPAFLEDVHGDFADTALVLDDLLGLGDAGTLTRPVIRGG
jgi:hypothetical protein